MSKTSLKVLFCVSALLPLIVIVVGLVRGSAAVCDDHTISGCIRDWVSAMAGPLAILAAIIAAWPVFEQLEEGRIATRLSLASVIKIQEDEKSGIMQALKDEHSDIMATRKVPQSLIKTIEAAKNIIPTRKSAFDLIQNDYHNYVQVCRDTALIMRSKRDKETILSERIKLDENFTALAEALGDLFQERNSGSTDGILMANNLINISSKTIESIDSYSNQYLALDGDIAIERDQLSKRREDLIMTIGIKNTVPFRRGSI